MNRLSLYRIGTPALLLGLALVSGVAMAGPADLQARSVANVGDPSASYKQMDLKTLVGNSRTEVRGQRVIFAPSPIRFQARLTAMPAPQKTDYLKKALGMMGVGNTIKVSRRIGLDYGGDKALAAYVDDAAAARLSKEGKLGQLFEFYAYHVYNNAHGPALVVVAFSK